MLDPLSAIIASPTFNFSINPDCITNSLSDMEPPNNVEINENAPDGLMPANALAVL